MSIKTSTFRLGICHGLLWAASSNLLANGTQPIETIAATAEKAIREIAETEPVAGRIIHVDGVSLDPRLRLPHCRTPLQGRLPAGAARSPRPVVEVSCAALGWKLNVPISVQSELPVLLARRNLIRGSALDPQDFTEARRTFAGLAHSRFVPIGQLAGRQLQRPMAAGTALEYSMLESIWSVRRGQTVVLLARSDFFEIRAQGVALRDGLKGERIQVRSNGSEKVVDGVVFGDSTVLIQP